MSKRKSSRKTPAGPGRNYRKGISIIELFGMFPDNVTSEHWFELVRWGTDFENWHCPRCGCLDRLRVTPPTARKRDRYHCGHCKRYFNVRTNTVMQASNISFQKWAIAIYYFVTNLKGISSMKMHRELGITQKSAWFLDHRIREVFQQKLDKFDGPVEVDETYIGGKEKNKHWKKRRRKGRGPIGKAIVIGIKDRKTRKLKAKVIADTKKKTMQSVVLRGVEAGSRIYTDEHKSYNGLANRKSVNHQRREYVRGKVHTNGIESFWALLKRGEHGIYHHISPKHLQRYVNEFTGRNNIRDLDTKDQMHHVVAGMVGKRLTYRKLVGPKTRRKSRLNSQV